MVLDKRDAGRGQRLWRLFWTTLYISSFTFGGGFVIVTFMKRKFVDELGWIDEEEMLDFTALAQSCPGAIAVNAAILVGWKVCGLADAHSSELDPGTKHPVIDLMPDQVGLTDKGGTMRLGSWPCALAEGSLAARAYGTALIHERHRHRYEFNNDYREALTAAGLALTGLSPDGRLVEIVELPGHPWFVGVQFHPELKSRPNRAHPLFREFIAAAKAGRK